MVNNHKMEFKNPNDLSDADVKNGHFMCLLQVNYFEANIEILSYDFFLHFENSLYFLDLGGTTKEMWIFMFSNAGGDENSREVERREATGFLLGWLTVNEI